MMFGFVTLFAVAISAAWNISSGYYWLLPINAVGFVFGVLLVIEGD